jgi:hypothetical protein
MEMRFEETMKILQWIISNFHGDCRELTREMMIKYEADSEDIIEDKYMKEIG